MDFHEVLSLYLHCYSYIGALLLSVLVTFTTSYSILRFVIWSELCLGGRSCDSYSIFEALASYIFLMEF